MARSGASIWLLGLADSGLERELSERGHHVELRELDDVLARPPASLPDVALVRPGAHGPVVLARQLGLLGRATAWIVLLGSDQAAHALGAIDAGATDVAVEPLAPGAAAVLVERALREVLSRARQTQEQAARGAGFDDIIGRSPAVVDLVERISRVTRRSALGPPLSVLFTGETGTGKGLAARVLHYAGRRRDGPFIEVNCAALPATLLESELFGHERGAFTDAKSARVGLLEAAHGGTVLLDEVTYLPPEGQGKLLTALETRRVRRLGSLAERDVDVQIVAATSHDVDALVASGGFRAELYHRLASIRFHLPPLRERGDDVVLLAEHFLSWVARSYGLPRKHLSAAARAALVGYAWPGNVRELFHAVQRAVLSEESEQVEAADLMLTPGSRAEVKADESGSVRVSLPPGGVALEEVERALIARALQMEKGNVTRAAALLRLTRDTLRSRMERYGLP